MKDTQKKKAKLPATTYVAVRRNIWQRVKVLAALRGVQVRDLVDELLTKAVDRSPEGPQINAAIKPIEK
jgi:hypothetical protein